jgi:NADH:ubiquinone oxidoreductase subunit E
MSVSEREATEWRELDEYIEQTRDPRHPRASLVDVLDRAQQLHGHLPRTVIQHVAWKLGLPIADVLSVATCCPYFSMAPRARYTVSVCTGFGCYVNGAMDLLRALERELGVGPNQVTNDGLFSIRPVRCMGACGLAPVITVNDEVHANLEPNAIPDILARYRARRDE